MPESHIIYSTPIVKYTPEYHGIDESIGPKKKTITAFQAMMYEKFVTRYPRFYYSLGPRLTEFYERQPRSLTQKEQYHYAQSQQAIAYIDIMKDIEYVQSLQPSEKVTFESGEVLTRGETLKRLEEQKSIIFTGRQQIREYQETGYRIKQERTGAYVFYKTVETKPISKSELIEKEWQTWHQKATKKKPVETFARDISYSFLKIFDPGTWGAAFRGELPEYLHREDIQNIKDIQKGKSWEVWGRVQLPAYEHVIIPAAAGIALTPIVGAISKTGIVISKSATTISSKILGETMQVYPYVIGGIGLGMGAGKVTGTFALEQKGIVKPYSTVEAGIGFGMQVTSVYAGYRVGRTITGPKFRKEIISVQDQITGREYAFGRKYFEIRGRPIYYGKTIYGGARSIIKGKPIEPMVISQKSVIPVSQKPIVAPGYAKYQRIFTKAKIESGLIPRYKVPKWKSVYEPSELETFRYKPIVWKKPEDIITMPHKMIVDTKVFITRKGTKIISTTDRGTRIGATVKPLDIGITGRILGTSKYSEALKQKGAIIDLSKISSRANLFMVSGISKTKGLIPSERLFYGIVTSKEIPTKISDITAIKSIGSFHVGTRAASKAIVPYKKKEISFKGRLFDETDYMENIILSRLVGGEIGKPGKFGFTVKKTPEVTYFVSKGLSKGINIVEAKGIALIVKKQIDTNINLFAGPGKDIVTKSDLFSGIQLGGLSSRMGEYPRLFEKPESSVLTKGKRGLIIDSETEIASPFWEGIKPKPVSRSSFLISKELKSDVSIDTILGIGLISRGELKTEEIKKTGLLYILGKKIDIRTITGLKHDLIPDILKKTEVKIATKLKKETMLNLLTKQITITTVVPPPSISFITTLPPSQRLIPTKTPPPAILGFELKKPYKQISTEKDSYHVFVKYRQYKEGIKIGKGELKQITRKPLISEHAKAYGGSKVRKSEKATFVLKRAAQKPGKLPPGVDPWYEISEQFYEKEPGIFIEKTSFRIDTPGEIRGISMRGWIAPKKGKKTRIKSWGF